MKTKKQFLLIFALIIIFSLFFTVSLINLGSAGENPNSCSLNVSLVSQDPDPATPGEYIRLVFQISGVDNSNCDGAKFELIPSYPFSIDNNDTLRTLGSYIYTPDQTSVWTIPYKVRVDNDALNGENELKVRYNADPSNNWNIYSTKTFNITIEDSRTSFDAVIQETSSSDVSIAIANTGRYAANSMIVKIPEQENFRVSGTSGQMVGNLDSGDYTIVGFTIIPNIQRAQGVNNQSNKNILKVQVDYTDGIGQRRTSILEIPFAGNSFSTNSTGTTGTLPNGFPRRQTSSSIFSKWYFWVIIIVVLLLGFGFYNKYKTRIKNHFAKNKDKSRLSKEEKSSETPDWVKKAKEKSK